MIAPFVIALLALPVIEIVVALLVAGAIGWWLTLLALLLMSAAGEAVLRRASRRTTQRLGDAMRGGRTTDADVTDSAMTMLGGLLLLIPGFVTGTVGLVVVFPLTRPIVRRLLARRLGRHVHVIGRAARRGSSYDVIEGEVVEHGDGTAGGGQQTGPRSLGG